jgi:hypothetical protein
MYLRVPGEAFTSVILDYCKKDGDIDELISVRFHFTELLFQLMTPFERLRRSSAVTMNYNFHTDIKYVVL